MIRMIGQIAQKRKLFSAVLFFVLFCGITSGISSNHARAGEESSAKFQTESIVSTPKAQIEQFMSAVRLRNHQGVVEALTPRIASFFADGTGSPRVVMNTIRLQNQAIYNHNRYQVIEDVSSPRSQEDMQIHKVQIFDRNGVSALVLFRLVHTAGQGWHIDGWTLIGGSDTRGA